MRRHFLVMHREREDSMSNADGGDSHRQPIACRTCAKAKTKCDKLVRSVCPLRLQFALISSSDTNLRAMPNERPHLRSKNAKTIHRRCLSLSSTTTQSLQKTYHHRSVPIFSIISNLNPIRVLGTVIVLTTNRNPPAIHELIHWLRHHRLILTTNQPIFA